MFLENIMTIKFTKCDPKSQNDTEETEETTQPKANLSSTFPYDGLELSTNDANKTNNTMDASESDEKHTYPAYLYLDGAIIEPISPASPLQTVLENLSLHEQSEPAPNDENPSKPEEPPEVTAVNTSLPMKNKRGRKPRKKKSQPVMAKKVKPNIINNSPSPKEMLDPSIDEAPNLEPEASESNDIVDNSNPPENIEIINLIEPPQDESQKELKNSPDQTNDLEILSKSITTSVDTSMLPPRKRYKRLMYLENNKPGSPKEVSVVDTTQKAEISSDVPESEDTFGEWCCTFYPLSYLEDLWVLVIWGALVVRGGD